MRYHQHRRKGLSRPAGRADDAGLQALSNGPATLFTRALKQFFDHFDLAGSRRFHGFAVTSMTSLRAPPSMIDRR